MDTQQARTRLEQLLAELDESASVVGSDGADTAVQDDAVEDSEDVATDLVDADRDDASREIIAAQRQNVIDALARIDAGTYGICIDNGEVIPDERLEARPEVARCIKDQEIFEATH